MGKRDRTNLDDIKGRAKRAYGEATDNQNAKDQGTVDKVSGKIKSGIDNVRDKAHDIVDRKHKKH